MRKLALLIFFLAPALYAQTYSTTFPLTENPISEGHKWINGGTCADTTLCVGLDWKNVQTVPGASFGTQTGNGTTFDDSTAVLAGSWGPNQTVTVKVGSLATWQGGEMEIRLHTTITPHSITGYEVFCLGGPVMQIVRWEGALGAFTLIGSGTTPCTPNDLFKATIVNNANGSVTITAFINNVQVLTTTDSGANGPVFLTGNPGLGFFNDGGVTVTSNEILSFTATATGSSTVTASLTPASLTFPSQTVGTPSAGQNVTLTNTSAAGVNLTISNISFTGANPGDYSQTNACPGTLASGANCVITVKFTPTATGTRTASLSVSSNATSSPQSTSLSGTATGGGGGSTFTAASCNQTDVNAVINGPTHVAVNGDTIQIPAGTCTWTSPVTISGIGITIRGTGTTNALPSQVGAGASTTILIHNVSGGVLFHAIGIPLGQTMRISTMTMQPIPSPPNGYVRAAIGMVGVCTAGGCPSVRVDNITFPNTWNVNVASAGAVILEDNVFGVFDHNTSSTTGPFLTFIQSALSAYLGVGANGDNSWAQPDTMGTAQSIYIENNDFSLVGAWDSDVNDVNGGFGGPRVVCRYNNYHPHSASGACNTAHGTSWNGRLRGPRQTEMYRNTDTYTGAYDTWSGFVGGTGRVFQNNVTANMNKLIALTNERDWHSSSPYWYCDGAQPWDTNDGVVYASGSVTTGGQATFSDNTKAWTVNQWFQSGLPYSAHDVTQNMGGAIFSNTATQYSLDGNFLFQTWNVGDSYQILRASVCLDQPARGRSIYYSGTGCGPGGVGPCPANPANQPLDPIYEWADTISTSPPVITSSTPRLLANRDWYAENVHQTAQTTPTSPFNGSSGTGHGVLANRPTTCTTGVGYWATDQGNWNTSGDGQGSGQLYICTATNIWSLNYTPFTYPHPLISGGGAIVPNAPTNLTATVAGSNVNLAWTLPSGTLTSIKVYRSTVHGGPYTLISTLSGTSTTFTDTPGTGTFFYVVTASNSAGESARSNEASATIGGAVTATLAPASLTYAAQLVGTPSTGQNVTFSNTSGAGINVVISSIAFAGANPGDFSQTNTCPGTLSSGTSCVITVKFTPTAAGSRTASLAVSSNAVGSPQITTVSGTGTAAVPGITLVPSSIDFASQAVSTTSTTHSVVLTNTGTGTLSITSITLVGTNSGDFGISNTCGATVAPSGTCNINLTFTPSATGIRTASAQVVDSAAGSPHSVSLQGTGITVKCQLTGTTVISGITIVCGP